MGVLTSLRCEVLSYWTSTETLPNAFSSYNSVGGMGHAPRTATLTRLFPIGRTYTIFSGLSGPFNNLAV